MTRVRLPLRLPLRLARREVRRRPGRTALVALLVALPVAGMAMAVTLIRTDHDTPRQLWERQYGQADAAGYTELGLESLPDGSRQIVVETGFARVKAADGKRAGVALSDLPLNDPLTAGIYELVDGRAPTRAGDVALSVQLADALGVGVGDELVLDRPKLTATVVGEVEPVGCLSCGTALFAAGELPDTERGVAAIPESVFVLVDLPEGLSSQVLQDLQGAPPAALEVREVRLSPYYDVAENDTRGQAVRWSLVLGALVLTVVGIVVSAAFAVGARRQLVTLGQLSASGASPATVRTALVLQGTVTGIVGSLVGLVLAAGLLLFGQPLVERLLDERIDGYVARFTELGAVVAIGVVAATLAALIPARTAARIPTLAALAGRRPLPPVSRRLVTGGFVSVLGGLSLLFVAVLGSQSGSSGNLWALVAIVGGVAELLGACAIAPAVVSRLEPLAHRMRGSLRLGARSLARHRARTGAVVSAVAAAGALAVAAGGLLLGSEARNYVETSVPDDVLVVAQGGLVDEGITEVAGLSPAVRATISELLPGARVIDMRGIAPVDRAPAGRSGWWEVQPTNATGPSDGEGYRNVPSWDRALLAQDDLLDALRVGSEVREAIDGTGVVVLVPVGDGGQWVEGPVSVITPDGRQVPGVAVPHRYSPGYSSGILLSATVVADLGLEIQPLATLFETPEPFTAEQRGTIEDLQYDLQDDLQDPATGDTYVDLQWAAPRSGPSPFQLELVLTGVALVFSLFVVGVSLALAAAESKDERDILTIAGAPPGTLARSAGARAWLLAVIGTSMAVPVGFLPVVVFATAQAQDQSGGHFDDTFPLVFPTRTVLLLVLAVPLIVAAVSFTSSVVAQRLRPVRVSTATFE